MIKFKNKNYIIIVIIKIDIIIYIIKIINQKIIFISQNLYVNDHNIFQHILSTYKY